MPGPDTRDGSESAAKPAEGITGYFDRTLSQFREQFRRAGGDDHADRARRWSEMIKEAARLRDRIHSDERVLCFEFNHDHEEISVKIADPSRHSQTYFVLSRHNPDTLEIPSLECVWLRQIGEPDVLIQQPMDALRELAVRVARLLV